MGIIEVATEDEGWCSFTSCTPSRSRARTHCSWWTVKSGEWKWWNVCKMKWRWTRPIRIRLRNESITVLLLKFRFVSLVFENYFLLKFTSINSSKRDCHIIIIIIIIIVHSFLYTASVVTSVVGNVSSYQSYLQINDIKSHTKKTQYNQCLLGL